MEHMGGTEFIRTSGPRCQSRSSSIYAHNNKMLYLATIGHETAQHSTSLLHAAFRLLLTSPIAPARVTRLLAISPYVSGFEKRDHFALKIDFELVVLSHSTVDGLSVALCCASIVAPVPELRSLKVREYARCNYIRENGP